MAGASGSERKSGGSHRGEREPQGSCCDSEGRVDGDSGLALR